MRIFRKVVLFVASPGSGKSTIAKRIERDFAFVHVSSGNLFRREVENQSVLGKKVQDVIDTGSLVDDRLTMEVFLSFLSNHPASK